jgi:hypothetical protein
MKCGVEFADVLNSVQKSTGDLGRLQQAIKTGKPIPDAVIGDGSICVVRSQGEWESCETIASFLEAIHKSDNKTLIINGGGSHLFDDTLAITFHV